MENAVGSRKNSSETTIECEELTLVAQLDGNDKLLRVNAETDARELLAVLQGIDLPVDAGDITQIPSICCGGCSG